MTADPRTVLDEWVALANGATEGPWAVTPWSPKGVMPALWAADIGRADQRGPYAHMGATRDADAAFIAAARTGWPQAAAAIRAVLGVHERVDMWEVDSANGTWVRDEEGEQVPLPSICGECTPRDSLLAIEDCEWTEDDPVVHYPCPTVRALADALTNGTHDG